MRRYSWLIALFAIFALAFVGFIACDDGDGDGNNGDNATLKIVNNYTGPITKVESVNFDEGYTTPIPTGESKSFSINLGANNAKTTNAALYADGLCVHNPPNDPPTGLTNVDFNLVKGKTTTLTLKTDGTTTVQNP